MSSDKAASHSSGSLANTAAATQPAQQPATPTPTTATEAAATLPAAPAPAAQATAAVATDPATQANAAVVGDPAAQASAAVAADPAAQAAAPAPQPAGVRVRSQPSGATVTLLDSGKNWELGKTPFAVTLDRTRSYEIIVAMPGYDTKVVQIEAEANDVSVALTPTAGTAAAAAAVAPAAPAAPATAEATKPATTDEPAAKAEPETATAEPSTKSERKRSRSRSKSTASIEKSTEKSAEKSTGKASDAPRARVAAAESAGSGTLMVSSKPPCDIAIDGKVTSLTTPQRSIKLAPGKHKVTLINAKFKVNKTFEVNVEAKGATKLIKDFMSSN